MANVLLIAESCRLKAPMPLCAKILVLSDAAAGGRREDRSGPAVRELLEKRGWLVKALEVLPDDAERIRGTLMAWTDGDDCDAVFTSGEPDLAHATSRRRPRVPSSIRISPVLPN